MVEIVENESSFSIVVDPKKYLIERKVDIGLANATIGISVKSDGKEIVQAADLKNTENVEAGGIVIKQIDYPKDFFTYDTVRETADRLNKEMENGTCKPCVIIKDVEQTKKVFMLPTLRDFLGACLGCDLPEQHE